MFERIFIRKPMKYNFIITLFLMSISIIYLSFKLYIYKAEITILYFFILLIWIVDILFFFSFFSINKGDLKNELGSSREQFQKILENGSNKIGWSSLAYIVMYAGLSITYKLIFMEIENDFFKIYLDHIFLFIICLLLFSRLSYNLLGIAPFLIYVSSFIIFLLLSGIGIESSFLNWTFLSLLFVTALPQLINENLILIVPQKIRKKIPKNKIKVNLMKIRLNLFIFLVFFYFCLNLSEKISKSNEFAYLINKNHYSHYSPLEFDFFLYSHFSVLF